MNKGTKCSEVLTKLIEYFARFGLPDVVVSDNGPPFNSFSFKSFLQKQGINALNSPPYNPASNGQAERLVRTVKDVLKKFLLEPEMLKLSLEDQINLFLFNYRNNNLTMEGSFPSEKVFAYTPKMLIDLVNPKKHYRQMLVPKTPDVESVTVSNHTNIQLDPLDALIPGDVLWYKHNVPHMHEKWIKASFLKRLSKNLLQIMVGSGATTTTHPTQIRVVKNGRGASDQNRTSMRVVQTGRQLPTDAPESEMPIENDEITVRQLPDLSDDATEVSTTRRARKRKHIEPAELTGLPRRSSRIKRSRLDSEFEYY